MRHQQAAVLLNLSLMHLFQQVGCSGRADPWLQGASHGAEPAPASGDIHCILEPGGKAGKSDGLGKMWCREWSWVEMFVAAEAEGTDFR